MAAPRNSKSGEYSLTGENQLAPGEVVIGEIEGLSARGEPLVNFPQNGGQQPVAAISTVAINVEHKGRQVALLFSAGDLSQPLIIGLIHSPLQDLIDSFELVRQEEGWRIVSITNERPTADNPIPEELLE